ncbi:TPA: type II toxin-antitoxin system VapC family toxin [Kluyvera intermedia]|nr:type II toxin-antitoxin system VapC family toxin [Kluyvera intermedia]
MCFLSFFGESLRVALAGTPIGPNDTAIAGHAIAAGVVLVTNNTREFERVPGLILEDWVK